MGGKIVMKMNKIISSTIVILSMLSSAHAQLDSPPYEYFFYTTGVPGDTEVKFALVSQSTPRWDEDYLIASGVDSVVLTLEGNYHACYGGNNMVGVNTGDSPAIGYTLYKVKVLNSEKNAYFYLKAEGEAFNGDIHFMYDWPDDKFYTGGDCDPSVFEDEVTNGQFFITHSDNGSGNVKFQPSNPSGLSISISSNHPKLDWTESQYPSFTTIKYKVQRKPSGGSWTTPATNLSSPTWTDYDVWTNIAKNRIRYYYRIQAYTDETSPGYSNEASLLGVLVLKQAHGMVDEQNLATPANYAMSTYPNPFNPITIIHYALPKSAHVIVQIFDVSGRKVRTVVSASQSAGYYEVQWNGQDESGRLVNTGTYFAHLQAGEFSKVIKMVYLR